MATVPHQSLRWAPSISRDERVKRVCGLEEEFAGLNKFSLEKQSPAVKPDQGVLQILEVNIGELMGFGSWKW